MTRARRFVPAAVLLLALSAGEMRRPQGARAQAEEWLGIRLCGDRREPYLFYWSGVVPVAQSTVTIPVRVPSGKRAVVELLTLDASVPKGPGPIIHYLSFAGELAIRRGAGPVPAVFPAVASTQIDRGPRVDFLAQAKILAFVDPGDTAVLTVRPTDGVPPQRAVTLTLSGYLTDPPPPLK